VKGNMISKFGYSVLFTLCLAMPARADTVILHDGSSYSGQFTGARNREIQFTDAQGIKYRFPMDEVQSLVFTSSTDTVTLRNGKVYSGHYTGSDPISFSDAEGIQYQFPRKDLESIVLTRMRLSSTPPGATDNAKVIPDDTDIMIRTDENIDSESSSTGQLYSATVSQEVYDGANSVAIPRGTPAKLLIRNITTGGAVHSPELVLDLFSIDVNGKEYRVVSSDVDVSNRKGVGGNRRTAQFVGGGTGLGALLGAVLGGGKGAAIGAATGAGGGLIAQVFTRGKQVKIPAESLLTFRLDRTLVLRPKSSG
jgi:outer membrane lipoprotein SlyB